MRDPRRWLGVLLTLTVLVAVHPRPALAADAAEIRKESSEALARLYANNEAATALGEKAKAILVFPHILKAGFIFGGQGGDGALRKGGKTVAYYRNLSASYGFQAGAQEFSYVLFLMTDSAVQYLDKSDGWELGSGP